jgi:D-beta-D-heptose 7-phosphate kinase/D-beta-D-heptose 1-phosphate adenosyltransferase
VLVDPKGRDFNRYKGATMITPNLAEFEAVVGHCESETIMQERAQSLIDNLELDRLLVTRGNRGMTLFEANGTRVDSDAKAREVFDVSGAGDTVIAAMAVAHCAGLTAADALTLANTAAGLVVRRLGTAIVSHEELIAALHEQERA